MSERRERLWEKERKTKCRERKVEWLGQGKREEENKILMSVWASVCWNVTLKDIFWILHERGRERERDIHMPPPGSLNM